MAAKSKPEPKAKVTTAKPKAAAKTAKAKKTRTMPALPLSAELAALVGTQVPRGDVIRKVWDYIKEHNLQDPNNKRSILPDAKLAKIFGSKEPLDMFKLSGLLGKHMKG